MRFNYSMRSVEDKIDLMDLKGFIELQDLQYPRYFDWVDKTVVQLELGIKKAILCFEQGSLVGDIIYQPHQEISRFRELKNIRIHSKVRGRGVASFLLKQVEIDDVDSIDALIVDARKNATDMNDFLTYSGFMPIIGASLYDSNEEEIVYLKPIKKGISTNDVFSYFPSGKHLE